MAGRSVPDRWKVAFSLAGENRELVGAIASDVERQLGESTVFYDEWFEFLIAGEDADIALQRIYGKRSDLVVGCISGAYDVKPWTRIERRAIRAIDWEESAFNGVKRVLWVRVGPGEVEGILPNAIVPDFTQKSVSDAAQLIIDRLGLVLDSVGVRDTSGRDRPDAEGAIGDFDEAVRLEPANAVAYTNRGTARRDMGDVEGAIGDFDEAIRLEPGNVFAYTNRGTARRDMGDVEGAIEDFDEASRLDPGFGGRSDDGGS